MTRLCLLWAFFCLACVSPGRAFSWETASSHGRDYVTLQSFCAFYNFGYADPGGNAIFDTRNAQHMLRLKMGSPDMWLDGVHYVMSFPIELGDHDWLVSRMDVIKLFEPVLRPQEIAGRHAIRGVVIDAGHGGTDNGATSRLGAEKNYTIDTAYRLQAILQNAGLRTVMTRQNDVFVDLYERAHIASLYPDYAFVSIHFNSAEEEARGLETYCLAPRGAASTSSNYVTRSDIQMLTGNDDDACNILLASAVHSEIIRLNPGDPSMDRGVKRARFVVIKANMLPAILVEGGFVSNRMESARVNSPGYRQALAECIARGLVKFVNLMGNRHMALPGGSFMPAPQAMLTPSVAGTAPAGLARGSQNVHGPVEVIAEDGAPVHSSPVHAAGTTGTTVKATVAPSTAKNLRKKKKKSAAVVADKSGGKATPVPKMMAPGASQSVSMPPEAPEAAKGNSLGLSEGTPAPTPGSEKAVPEPDEPPTVNGSSASSKSSDHASHGVPADVP